MKTVNGTLASLVVILGVFTVPAMAQKTLYIVDSEGNALEQVELDQGSTVDLLADGVRAQASGYSCSAEVSCDADVAIEEFSISHDGSTYTAGDEFTIEQGQCFNVSWSTLGPWAVQGIGLSGAGWAGSDKGVSGTQQICTGDLTLAVHDITLRPYNCGGNGDTCGVEDLQTIFAQVVEPTSEPEPSPEPEGCEPLSNYSGWSQVTSDLVYGLPREDATKFSEVFGKAFPGATGNSETLHLDTGNYAAVKFTTPSDLSSNHSGRFKLEDAGSFPGTKTARSHWSISKCPGEFNPNNLTNECHVPYTKPGWIQMQWRGPNNTSAKGCELQPNTTYYLNLLYSDSQSEFPPMPKECGSYGCGNLTEPANVGF